MHNVKGIVEYDGTNYSGWQRQTNSNSIQQTIEDALSTVFRENTRIIGSGRTDAGVHALNQVFNFRVGSEFDISSVQKSINAILPDEISVKSLEFVDDEFHSRYSATSREYLYIISLRKNIFYKNYSWTIFGKHDFNSLKRTQELFIGRKNFDAFSKNTDEIDNAECEVSYSRWFFKKDFLFYIIKADRFIHGMVRGIVGCMLETSRGRITLDEVENLFFSEKKTKNPLWAPASGLFLYKVNY